MARVVGLGGVFFKVADQAALADWYRRVLGFDIQEGWTGAMWPSPERGQTIWSAFEADSDYFAPSTQPFMINFVVEDLDGLLVQARAAGAEPLARDDSDPHGRFAWLLDPAGVKVELWEPKPPSVSKDPDGGL